MFELHKSFIWRSLRIIAFLSVLNLVCACGSSGTGSATIDTPLYTPKYATGFEILGEEGKESTLLRVTAPWQGENTPVRELFIRRNDETVPHGFTGQVINGDAERIVCMSSTQIAMLHLVGASDNVIGVSGINFITDQDIQSRRADIGDVGYDGNINYELLVNLKPDLVLLYGVSAADPMENKLKELGIPYIYIGEYVEESPLGKAEWMMAVAETVGKRHQAEEVFQQIPEKYEALKQRVAQAGESRPKVMLNMPYGDSWFLPPNDSYFVTLLNDAGAEYVYSANNTKSSKAVDMEEAYLLASKADKWLNLGSNIKTPTDLWTTLPKFASLPVVRTGGIYNNTERLTAAGGNDFYESGVVNPDLVLRDLIKIMHPSLVSEPFTYYRHLTYSSTSDEEEDPTLSDLADLP